MTANSKDSLIERLKQKDKTAQNELIKKFNARLLVYFRLRIKGEESYQDLVQEVLVSFFVGVEKDKIPGDDFIAPYIYGIAKRVMFNYFYNKKRNAKLQEKGETNFELSYDFEEAERLENEDFERDYRAGHEKTPGNRQNNIKRILPERKLSE